MRDQSLIRKRLLFIFFGLTLLLGRTMLPQSTFGNPIVHQDTTNGVVIIDDLHGNDYVPSDMNDIFDLLATNNYIGYYATDFESWSVALDAANILIISTPRDDFTSQERAEVVNWMNAGAKNLIVSTRGDFSTYARDSINDLLTDLGSNIRVQDDNVYSTNPYGSNPSSRWYVDSSNIQASIPGLNNGVNRVEFFSPSSLRFIDSLSVDVVFYGDGDEYQTDQNPPAPQVIYDNTDDGSGGETIPLIANEELTLGVEKDNVMVFGTTTWSDFNLNGNDNFQFLANVLQFFTASIIAEEGNIVPNIPDNNPPTVKIVTPRDGWIVQGIVEIKIVAQDVFGVDSYEILIDGVSVSAETTYQWDTTIADAGSHTVTARATDFAGNVGEVSHTVTVDQDYAPKLDYIPKIMTYNVKQSGIQPEWLDVMKEENSDVVILIETGDWDNNNHALLDQYVNELNVFFNNEIKYEAVIDSGSGNTQGSAILSRFPIIFHEEINSLILDSGQAFGPVRPFLHATINVNGFEIELLGSHLKAFPGIDNEARREKDQEGIINWMDTYPDKAFIYAGDFNSYYPGDTGELGDGPVDMLINPDNEHASEFHTFTDVHKVLHPTDPGVTYPDFDERIDFIFVNQVLDDFLVKSTTGDTMSAFLGSDHLSVDVNIDLRSLAGITETLSSTTLISSESTSGGTTSSNDNPVSSTTNTSIDNSAESSLPYITVLPILVATVLRFTIKKRRN